MRLLHQLGLLLNWKVGTNTDTELDIHSRPLRYLQRSPASPVRWDKIDTYIQLSLTCPQSVRQWHVLGAGEDGYSCLSQQKRSLVTLPDHLRQCLDWCLVPSNALDSVTSHVCRSERWTTVTVIVFFKGKSPATVNIKWLQRTFPWRVVCRLSDR